ncbi:hypothetical protein HYC85_013470 [Camellia sinensis]|uniref:Alcohol dehydrogenase-like C-terminal domain-containing protein n=1 Tax=Camellia sinensis TaxID=4442 RepID=A0A7J7H3F8_CAMSI|nr:hypothetical protein HYC85_013470 [Camellia sinensis]
MSLIWKTVSQVIAGAQTQGAGRIIGVDTNKKKREKGVAFGMTDFINPSEHSKKSISELTGGLGVDYCFECTGVGALVNETIKSIKPVLLYKIPTHIHIHRGVGIAILLGAGTHKSVEINFMPLLSGRAMKYSVFGGIKVQSDLPVIVDKCINKCCVTYILNKSLICQLTQITIIHWLIQIHRFVESN